MNPLCTNCELLQFVSALVLNPKVPNMGFVQLSSHVVSGMYLRADACVALLFVVLQYGAALVKS